MSLRLNIDAARASWHARFENRKELPAAGSGGKLDVRGAATRTEIMLYDEIGFWGVTAKQFNAALSGIESESILLRINSPGGDVFDGFAIYNALKAHPAQVDVVIEGLAASAASFVAMAGDTVTMSNPSLLMIHRAWTMALGNTKDMADTATLLSTIDQQIAGIYAERGSGDAAAFLDLMTSETWLTPEEAQALGLVDIVSETMPDQAAAAIENAHAARMRAARVIQLGVS